MPIKKLAVLAAALLVLGGLAALLRARADRLEGAAPLKAIAADDLFRLEIERQGAPPLSLEKKAGLWRLAAPVDDLADSAACADLAAALQGLVVGTEVSTEASGWAAYGLTEADAVHVKVFSRERAVAALDGWFGKPALGAGTLYFRRSREKPVYLAEGVEADLLKRPADAYRLRAFFPAELNPIASVTLTAGKSSLVPLRGDPAWKTAIALRAADFLTEPAGDSTTGLDTPVLSVEAAGAARSARWLIGKPRPEKHGKPLYRYARSEGRPGVIALVAMYDTEGLLKALRP